MVSKTVVDYLERIKRLYVLIKQERTGSLNDIARKMLLSRRTITNYISELKHLEQIFDMISAEIRIISIMSLPCMQLLKLSCPHNRIKK